MFWGRVCRHVASLRALFALGGLNAAPKVALIKLYVHSSVGGCEE